MTSSGYSIFTTILLSRNPGGNFGGYQSKFFTGPVEVLCIFCGCVPRDPHRLACGHIFCHDCLFNNILSRQVCTQCNNPVKREDCIPDEILASRISRSTIHCPYSTQCQWQGYIGGLAVHFSECDSVAPLLRSWMQSIQVHISSVEAETDRMESRVDRLKEQVSQMGNKCDAAGYEHERQLGWIENQMDYLKQEVLGSPRKSYTNRTIFDFNAPTPAQPTNVDPTLPPHPPPHHPHSPPHHPHPHPPPSHPHPYPHPQEVPPSATTSRFGIHIDDSQLTESLRYDLEAHKVAEIGIGDVPQARNVRFSNYEGFLRQDTGDSIPYETLDDSVFPQTPVPFHPDQDLPFNAAPVYTQHCLYCNHENLQDNRNCASCQRIL